MKILANLKSLSLRIFIKNRKNSIIIQMKLLKILILSLLIVLSAALFSQTYPGRYRIQFTDKNNNPFTLDRPGEFLSERAIQRRIKQNIPLSLNDLPVTPAYIDSVKAMGVPVYNSSKWFNAITTDSIGTELLEQIYNLSFVVRPTNQESPQLISGAKNSTAMEINELLDFDLNYGYSENQIKIHNGNFLHQQGFTGKGVQIAVIDAGFLGVDYIEGFSDLWSDGRILGTRDFVNRNSNIYREYVHGMHVLSIIAGNIPYEYVGTAPDASFWLLRSEDVNSEYLIEEDNWVSAAEFADSAGADIITSSLGYSTFWDASQDHTYEDMDGNSTRVSIAADIAASKGMLVVSSAGNLGNKQWKYISAPADADSVLAVGAIDIMGDITTFSSRGPSSDGRIKPDVCAVGYETYYLRQNGSIGTGGGTSFSAPIISGLAACLWQANPSATNMEIYSAIKESSDRYTTPDTIYGYGIPDFNLADIICKSKYGGAISEFYSLNIYPNPFNERINIGFYSTIANTVSIAIYNAIGEKISEEIYYINEGYNEIISDNLSGLAPGIYFVNIRSERSSLVQWLIKM
jgi:serine protease AprX